MAAKIECYRVLDRKPNGKIEYMFYVVFFGLRAGILHFTDFFYLKYFSKEDAADISPEDFIKRIEKSRNPRLKKTLPGLREWFRVVFMRDF